MNKKRAFTLIELLVVIAIIAVLMAILTPTLNRAREQGENVVCASTISSSCSLPGYSTTMTMTARSSTEKPTRVETVRPPCLQEAGIKASFGGRVMTARAVSGQDRSCRTRFR